MVTDRNAREEGVKRFGMRQWVLTWIVISGSAAVARSDHTIAPYVIASCGGTAQSANHSIRATLGEPLTGAADSENHSIRAGFWMAVVAPCDTDEDGIPNHCDPDLNNDGVVGIPDFNLFRACFGAQVGDPNYDPDCDFDCDGVVGIPDFNIFREFFGGAPGCE